MKDERWEMRDESWKMREERGERREETRHSTERMRGLESLHSIIAWRACHLLYQHRSSLALKHSFCYFLALKSSAKRRSVNHCREQSSKFPKTDAFGIFEAIKKSPFFNGNFLLSSSSANASAEIWKLKMKVERWKMREETRHSTEPDKARNGISNGIFWV